MPSTSKNKEEKIVVVGFDKYPLDATKHCISKKQIIPLFAVVVVAMTLSSCFFHEEGENRHSRHFGNRHSGWEQSHHRDGSQHAEPVRREESKKHRDDDHDKR